MTGGAESGNAGSGEVDAGGGAQPGGSQDEQSAGLGSEALGGGVGEGFGGDAVIVAQVLLDGDGSPVVEDGGGIAAGTSAAGLMGHEERSLELFPGYVDLGGIRAFLREAGDFLEQEAPRVAPGVRGGGEVDAEDTGPGEMLGPGVHGIGEALAFADPVEQARGGSTAEELREDGEVVSPGIVEGSRGEGETEMSLVEGSPQEMGARHESRGRGRRGHVSGRPFPEEVTGGAGDGESVEMAGDAEDHVGGGVPAPHEGGDASPVEGGDRVDAAEDGPSEWMTGPVAFGEEVLGEFLGGVFGGEDFLDDDGALAVEVAQGSVEGDVGEDLKGVRGVGGGDAGVDGGVFTSRGGVDVPAAGLDGFHELPGGPGTGTLEEQVFKTMGDAPFARGLVTGAGTDGDAQGGGSRPGEVFQDDGHAVGQPGDLRGVGELPTRAGTVSIGPLDHGTGFP